MVCSILCTVYSLHSTTGKNGRGNVFYSTLVLQYWRTKTTKTILFLTFLHNYIFYANKYNKSPVVWCTLQRTYFMAIKSIEKVSFTSYCYCIQIFCHQLLHYFVVVIILLLVLCHKQILCH